MIDAKLYQEQWDRLEAAIGYKLYEKSYPVWKKEIEENGYNGDRLIKAIDRIINRLSDGSLKPREVSLGTILSACRATYAPTNTQSQPATSIDNILQEGNSKASPFARELIANLKQYLTGKQDKQAWIINHKAICRKHKQLIPKFIFGKDWIPDNPPTKSHYRW